jgi:hypothetical protein
MSYLPTKCWCCTLVGIPSVAVLPAPVPQVAPGGPGLMAGTSVHPTMMRGMIARQACASLYLSQVVPGFAFLNFYSMPLSAAKTFAQSVLMPLELVDFSVLSAFVPSVLPLAMLWLLLVRPLWPLSPLAPPVLSTLLLFRSSLCRRMSCLVTKVYCTDLVEMRFADLKVLAPNTTCLLRAGAPRVPVQRMSSLWVIHALHFSFGRKTPFQIGSDLENC